MSSQFYKGFADELIKIAILDKALEGSVGKALARAHGAGIGEGATRELKESLPDKKYIAGAALGGLGGAALSPKKHGRRGIALGVLAGLLGAKYKDKVLSKIQDGGKE